MRWPRYPSDEHLPRVQPTPPPPTVSTGPAGSSTGRGYSVTWEDPTPGTGGYRIQVACTQCFSEHIERTGHFTIHYVPLVFIDGDALCFEHGALRVIAKIQAESAAVLRREREQRYAASASAQVDEDVTG